MTKLAPVIATRMTSGADGHVPVMRDAWTSDSNSGEGHSSVLLTTDLLVVSPVASVVGSNDSSITAGDGTLLGRIISQQGPANGPIPGKTHFSIQDVATGAVVARVAKVSSFGVGTYEVRTVDDTVLATIGLKLRFVKLVLSITGADGTPLTIDGSFRGRQFDLSGLPGPVARISRPHAGLGNWTLGNERYVLAFARDVPTESRQAMLGVVVAVDLIRAMERSNPG